MSKLHPNSAELFAHELIETTSIGGRKNVNVVIGSKFAATDGKNVYYPKFADGVVLSDEQVAVARALKNHEAIGHLRFTNIGAMQEYLFRATPLRQNLAQVMEDIAVEHRVMHGGTATDGEKMPGYLGTKADFSTKSEFVSKRIVAGATGVDYTDHSTILTHGLLSHAHAHVLGYDAPSTRALADKVPPYLRPVMQEFAELATKATTTGARMELIDQYLAAVKAAEPPPPPPPPPAMPDAADMLNEELEKEKGADGDGDGADGDGEKGDEGEGDTGSGDADGEGNGPSDDEEGDGDEGEGDEEEDEDGDGEEGENDGDEDGDDEGDDEGGGEGEAAMDGAPNPDGRGAVDAKVEVNEGEAGAVHEIDTKELMGEALAGAHDDTWTWVNEAEQVEVVTVRGHQTGLLEYEDAKRAMSAELAVIVSKLPRLLEDKARTGWLRGQPVGRLDTKRLVPVVSRFETNVFRRREEEVTINTAVTLLVDHSGSMGPAQGKMGLAAQVCIALAEALERVSDKGLAFEILGWNGGSARDYVGMQTQGLKMAADEGAAAVVCIGGMKLWVYKEFGEKLQVAKPRLAGMSRRAGGDNNDMGAIEQAAKRLMMRREPRRILMVLSDGAPATGVYFPTRVARKMSASMSSAEPFDPLVAATRREARRWARAGIEMVGIGIADQSVLKIYDRAVVVNKLSDLSETVFQELGQLLLGGRFVASNNADKMALAGLAAASGGP